MKKSTLIKLGVVAALVMLPRRSSKKAECSNKGCGCPVSNKADTKTDKSCETQQGCDGKNCKCPLCRIGKCPLCAIGKCFCCKKSADKTKNSAQKGCCGSEK